MSGAFLDRLASQLKIDKNAASRREIERILDTVTQNFESGKYQSPEDAERAFRRLVTEHEALEANPTQGPK